MKDSLQVIKSQTQSVYQDRARAFDRQRGRSGLENAWLNRFVVDLPNAGKILDLGCGSGEPVSAYLIDKGFGLTGIDYAASMIDIARQRFPDHDWSVGDMRNQLPGRQFHGLVSWNGFFHLSPDEQRRALPQMAAAVLPGGNILLTVGPAEGEVTGTVDGAAVYHASLNPAEYRQLLQEAGFKTVRFQAEDPDCGHHSVLLAIDMQH